MKVLLDSCIWRGAKDDLTGPHDTKWVGDFLKDPGDEAIMQLAVKENRVIITQDKDFGELAVFRGMPHRGIVRLVGFSATQHGKISLQILNQYESELSAGAIITVESDKVRIRTS